MRNPARNKAFDLIRKEIARQEKKWGPNTSPQRLDQLPLEWFAILSEEFGELAKLRNIEDIYFCYKSYVVKYGGKKWKR